MQGVPFLPVPATILVPSDAGTSFADGPPRRRFFPASSGEHRCLKNQSFGERL